MTSYVYYRLVAYVLTIILHVGHIVFLTGDRPKELLEDYRIKTFSQLQYRYLTVWTFFLQTAHAMVGLICELLNLWNGSNKNYELPKNLKGFRDSLFCSIVFPSCILVSSLFWTIYLYDRNLIFPPFLDAFLPPLSNHIMHTAIFPLALWEVWFQPRTKPKSHVKYVAYAIMYGLCYNFVIFYTYYDRGIWVYPLLKHIYNTLYFPLLVVGIYIYGLLGYTFHWVLVSLFWSPEKIKRKIQ